MTKGIDRRTFIKGGGVTLGAAALGLALAGCNTNEASPAPATTGNNNEEEFDFIIVGAGMGGACAALAADEAGMNYVVIEKAGDRNFGGDMSLSGGVINYQPPEVLYDLLMEYSGQKANRVIAKAMADNCKSTVDWLISLGVGMVPDGITAGHPGNGPGLAQDLKEKLEERNANIQYNTKAIKLITDDNVNRVTGVLAVNENGEKVTFKAKKGVLLSTGSYAANEEMMIRYVGTRDIIARGYAHNTGDGHRMALDVRAQLVNMGDVHGSPINPETRATFLGWYQHGIVVNRDCERFVNEMNPPTDYVVLGKSIFRQPGGIAYAILDDKWHDLVPEWNQNYYLNQLHGTLIEADTIAELAEKLGLDPVQLENAVNTYNDAVDEESLTAMSLVPPKTGDARKINQPPYVATPLVNGAALSFGGASVNEKAQVLDLEGEVIPGLYASGRTVGGLFYDNYVSDPAHGSAVGDAMVFGKLAADSAASE